MITLIHQGKDLPKNELKNWRPVSLTHSDYKLLSKCLPLRLSHLIHDIINTDQVEYIKGHSVSSLLRRIDDFIDQRNVSKRRGLLIAVDYFHAFDCIPKILC